MDKIKDVLYDSIDYIFMIVIILIVVGVIGWRLDVLFAKNITDTQPSGQIVVDNSSRDKEPSDIVEKPSDNSENEEEPSNQDPVEEPQDQPEEEPEEPEAPTSPIVVKIEIPVGSMPGKIGLILEENGLVSSSREFIAKAVELKLDTKLKSGTYNIQKGLSTEDIVKLIAN